MNEIKSWLYRIFYKLRWRGFTKRIARMIWRRDRTITSKDSTGSDKVEIAATPKRSDDPLIQKFLEGDERAFRELFDLYAPPIYRVTARFLASRDHSEELVVELFSLLRNEPATFNTSTMENFKRSIFERAKAMAKQKLGLPQDLDSKTGG